MRALILANGDPPSADLAIRLAAEHDLLMVTDGAAQRAQELGLRPDIICGDFDSIRMDETLRVFPDAEIVPTPDQDHADLEKALLLARARGAEAITITGASGGRIDHTLAGFALLLRYAGDLPLTLVEDGFQAWAVVGAAGRPGVLEIPTLAGDIVSVISFDGQANVSIAGGRWPLSDYPLQSGTQGVSNVALGAQVTVQAKNGAVLLCRLKREP